MKVTSLPLACQYSLSYDIERIPGPPSICDKRILFIQWMIITRITAMTIVACLLQLFSFQGTVDTKSSRKETQGRDIS